MGVKPKEDSESQLLTKPTKTIKTTLTQKQRAEQVTNKLLELQQKHKEISEKVQGILVDTVDFAFGANSGVNLKDAIKTLGEPKNKKSQRVDKLLQKLKEEDKKAQNEKNRKRAKIAAEIKQRREQEKAKQEQQQLLESMAYSQGVGSVPYGLPCLAVTRRSQVQQYQQYELERVNTKLCQIMRVPADFVDVEAESDDSENLFDAYSDYSYSGEEGGRYDEFEGSIGGEDEGDEVSITEEEEEEEVNGEADDGDGDGEDDWEDVQDEVEDLD